MQLSAQTVRLGATPRNKNEAIEMAGIVLADAGYIERAYIQSMMGRELQSNTCLGRGIAIPHGMEPDRHLIKQTGVAVVQMPKGVDWNEDERVELVVAIAAKSDEHLQILSSLMDVLDDDALIERLTHTTDVDDILDALNARKAKATTEAGEFSGLSMEAKVVGHYGLHARPATRLMQVASQFQSEIFVEYQGQRASAKSMVFLLKMGVPGGEMVRLLANGPDAEEALTTLKMELESGLGEDLNTPAEEGTSLLPTFQASSDATYLQGITAAPGLAIAPLFILRDSVIEVRDDFSSVEVEIGKFSRAIARSQNELQKLVEQMRLESDADEGGIFEAHSALLSDPSLAKDTEDLIRAGHGAAWAWYMTIQARAEEMKANPNALLAQRGSDFQDIGIRVLRCLGVNISQGRDLPDYPIILAARDLTPSQTVGLDTRKVAGLCLADGGPTSHTAILARSLGLPAVVGLGQELLELPESQDKCILDGDSGRLYGAPAADDLDAAHAHQKILAGKQDQDFADRFRPALTRDGQRMEIVANVGNAQETQAALDNGAEGVGLLRTELMFLGRDSAPSEEEQFEALACVTKVLGGLPLIVRTLDIGGDKAVSYLHLAPEENPFLGVRGVRLTSRHPELFETQLRAIFRASETGPVRILFPMIGTMEDWRTAHDFAEKVRRDMGVLEVDYGVMVEVPSAALIAQELAREVDFFSIGTNDLTQYTLAIDRMHPELGKESDPLHPAVLRLIAMTVEAARTANKWVGVCGSAADEVLGALILSGLGVSELSMSGPSIPGIKAALRQTDFESVKSLAQRALKCASAAEVRALRGRQ